MTAIIKMHVVTDTITVVHASSDTLPSIQMISDNMHLSTSETVMRPDMNPDLPYTTLNSVTPVCEMVVLPATNPVPLDSELLNIIRISVPATKEMRTHSKEPRPPPIDPVILPRNSRNSCFFHSVLVALFMEPNIAITALFLSGLSPPAGKRIIFGTTSKEDAVRRKTIQREIILFVQRLRQGGSGTHEDKLRQSFEGCNFTSSFNSGEQQDASEFFAALCEVFGCDDNVNRIHRQVYGSHDMLDTPPSALVLTTDLWSAAGITHQLTSWRDGSSIGDNMVQTTDVVLDTPFHAEQYHRVVTRIEFQPVHFFCVTVMRAAPGGTVNRTALFVDDMIDSSDGKTFGLVAMVLHLGASSNGGHYISLVKKDGKLMLFDDSRSGDLKPSTYTSEQIAAACTLVFYQRT